MLYILSRDFEVVLTANNVGNAMPYYDDLHKHYLEAGTGSYEFTIPSTHPNAELVESGNYVVRKGLDNQYLMFTIMSVEETHDANSVKRVYCEEVGLELLNEIEVPYKETSAKDIKHYINRAIGDTGWKIGYCDVTATRTLEFTSYENVLSRILKIATAFNNAEISFSVDIVGSRVTNRYVNIYKRKGTDNGKRFVYSKDITSIKRTVDMSQVATAILGVGRTDNKGNKTTFKSNTYDDGNIYTKNGSEVLFSRKALERWGQVAGNIFRVFEYDTPNSSELLNRAISDLKNRENPSVTYEVEIALLERLAGYEEEKVRVGDTVKIIDTTFNPELYLEARVMALETSYLDPSKDKAILGNYQIIKTNILQELRNIQSKLLEKEATWEQIGETIYKAMLAPQNPEVNDLWLDTSTEPNRLKRWDGSKWVLAGVYDPDDLGVYPKEKVDELINFTEWYSGVKSGTNLVRNVESIALPEGYEWIDDVTPDGTIGRILRKKHVGGTPVNNAFFYTPRIQVDPTKTYLMEFYVKPLDSNSMYYFGREEETVDGDENDAGNGAYSVSRKIATQEEVGKWKKHFALIPPHFAGLENDNTTQQSPYTPDHEFKFFSFDTGQIMLKTVLTYSPLDPNTDSEMYATGWGLYEVGSSDSLYKDLDSISNDLGEIRNNTTDVAIIDTVIASPDFESIMSDKANVEDLSDLATGEQLTDVKTGLENYVDGRLDGEGGINEKINEVTSSLERTANEIRAKFSSSGGINLIKNSLGFAESETGLDFWKGSMGTLQNLELEQLGFGSGFYSVQGEKNSIEQVVNTSRSNTYSISFWMKKPFDSGTNANAGVEIYAGGNLLAFVGNVTGETTETYELGMYTFTTEHSQITIKVVCDEGAEMVLSGLMLNEGDVALQWQHAPNEIYNTSVQMNLNGLKVLSENYDGYTIMSPREFSGYFETLDENNKPVMQRVFTLNKDTTEVTKLDVDEEITMNPIKIVPIASEFYNGWAFVVSE